MPSNTDLCGTETPMVGQQQQFDIERETVETLDHRQSARQITWKELETALSVSNSRQLQHPQHEVKGTPHEISMARLRGLHELSIDRSRSDHYAAPGRGSRQDRQLFDGRREIRVGKQHPTARGEAEAGTDSGPFATVDTVLSDLEVDTKREVDGGGRRCGPVR